MIISYIHKNDQILQFAAHSRSKSKNIDKKVIKDAKNNNKWMSSIKIDKKNKHIGYFNTKEEAAKSYNNYVILNKLEHTLNIIKED